ncbi:YfmQ family protein [Domibacillus indicus]|uniref:YfmQ family protein n=1 Tax=Domibacillus indicus TaxID=1437523 RepID=UPI00204161F7|nr:YfmQ family protein [Domibacillus indicus]MCM3788955.1 YfmQ family protein [Domibacillus indicus]
MSTTALLLTVVFGLFKILVTCLPTGAVERLIRKYEMHAKLSEENTTITFDGTRLEGEEKAQMIQQFNEASVLKKYYIFPGNESLFLQPENGGIPFVVDTKRGRKDVRLFVYRYEDHVDVVKQYKNKVIAYSVFSDSLQKGSMTAAGDLI